jgi:serine/threonine protein kinase
MEANKLLGRYAIEKPLISSEYASVYLATDTVVNRKVRLNVFDPKRIKKKSLRTALYQALQQAADLVHPHIAWVWDLGDEEGVIYAAERYIDGPTIKQVLQINQRMTWDEAYPVFRQAAQALEFAHTRKVLHGNLSPVNLILSPELGAVVLNFGLHEVFNPNSECTRYSDQADLARLLITMISSLTEFTEEPNLEEIWPLSAPMLVTGAIRRALCIDPAGPYASIEEFATVVSELASRPQPPLTPEQIQRMAADEARWRDAQEKARQAAEEAARQEALEAARKEINEQIQRAMDESTKLDQDQSEEAETPSEENPAEGAIQSSQETKQPAEDTRTESPDKETIETASAPQTEDTLASPPKTATRKSKRRAVAWIIAILLVLLLVAAIIWAYLSGFLNII